MFTEAAGMGADPRGAARRPVAPHQVVIVGCGFAGLFAAQALRGAPAEVTVIDRRALETQATVISTPGSSPPASELTTARSPQRRTTT